MQLQVNDKDHIHSGDGSVPALLAELGATPEHAAVIVNGKIVPKNPATPEQSDGGWEGFQLSEGDTVEVLTFVGGG